MQQLVLGSAFVGIGIVIGALSSDNTNGTGNAQFVSPGSQSGDALRHLLGSSEQCWFLHANNRQVSACNINRVNVVGDQPTPRCSKWAVDSLAFERGK